MAERAQQAIQKSMTALVDDLDKTHLREMQRSMHLCAAKCCEDKSAGIDTVHSCIDTCSTPLHQAQSYVQKELASFQDRLQRCVLNCQDQVKDRVTANTSESQSGVMASMGRAVRDVTLGQGGVNVYKAEFEACAMTCVDNHIDMLPNTKRRISDMLTRK